MHRVQTQVQGQWSGKRAPDHKGAGGTVGDGVRREDARFVHRGRPQRVQLLRVPLSAWATVRFARFRQVVPRTWQPLSSSASGARAWSAFKKAVAAWLTPAGQQKGPSSKGHASLPVTSRATGCSVTGSKVPKFEAMNNVCEILAISGLMTSLLRRKVCRSVRRLTVRAWLAARAHDLGLLRLCIACVVAECSPF